METKTVTIEGNKFRVPADAVYYKTLNEQEIKVYKIVNEQVFLCLCPKEVINLYWSTSVVASPEDITDSGDFMLLPGLSSKKTLEQTKQRQTQSWEEHPVHKEDQTKTPVHYCPPVAIEGIGQVLYNSTAIKKREPWNWREGQIDLMGYLGKAQRHILATIDKKDQDDLDPEIKTHHLNCAMADLAIIMDAMKQGTLVDNRPPTNSTKQDGNL
jgi:hypothetical protein